MQKAKNKILKGITWAAVIVFILSGMTLDSDSYIPIIAGFVSVIWLFLFVVANERR